MSWFQRNDILIFFPVLIYYATLPIAFWMIQYVFENK